MVHKETRAILALKSYDKNKLLNGLETIVHNEINSLAMVRNPSVMRLYEVID